MITLITAITPTIRSDVKFRHSQDEGNANFMEWAESNPAGALRRFQVRYDGAASPPEVSSELESQIRATFVVTVAYPLDAKAGANWGRDRDDEIESDFHKIDYKIGVYGRGNFSGTNSCTPLGARMSVERGTACDFLVVTADVLFYLDVDG